MKIDKITVVSDGFVHCRSAFYTSNDLLQGKITHSLVPGLNQLVGDIDSGAWAVSYLLSMYKHKKKDFILFDPARITVNGEDMSLSDFSAYSCYIDKSFPLFSTKKSVKSIVSSELKRRNLDITAEEIKKIFQLSDDRFERPLSGVGNEAYRAMCAIGYAAGKEVFCFPWLSDCRFEYVKVHIMFVASVLESLGKIVVLPTPRARHSQPFC